MILHIGQLLGGLIDDHGTCVRKTLKLFISVKKWVRGESYAEEKPGRWQRPSLQRKT